MEDHVLGEVVLCCSAMGSSDTVEALDGTLVETFTRGENCLQWLQDLQRYVRRDACDTGDACPQTHV
jgi:hypothetical protein